VNRYKLRYLQRGVIRLTHLNQKVRGKVAGMSRPDNERTKTPPEYNRNPDISRRSSSRNVVNPMCSLEGSISRVGQPQGKRNHTEGMGNGKKRKPPGNREDKGSKFTPRRKAADFPMVSNDKTEVMESNPSER
jgi:hypothetical protein